MKISNFQSTLPLEQYVSGHHAPRQCAEACRQCRNFNRIWACPPFDYDPLDRLRPYSYVTVFARKVELPSRTPLSGLSGILRPVKKGIMDRMLDLEKENDGFACILAGECDLCAPQSCTRAEGRVCRHPDITRPSLEAFGFNLRSTISDLFGLDFAWGTDGFAPPYLILVTALFHNSPKILSPDNR